MLAVPDISSCWEESGWRANQRTNFELVKDQFYSSVMVVLIQVIQVMNQNTLIKEGRLDIIERYVYVCAQRKYVTHAFCKYVCVWICKAVQTFMEKQVKILLHGLFHPFPRENQCFIIMDDLIDIFLCIYIINRCLHFCTFIVCFSYPITWLIHLTSFIFDSFPLFLTVAEYSPIWM